MDVRFTPSPPLAAILAGQHLLGDVVTWLFATGGDIVDIVVQDEYTHDVLVRLADGSVLVYETT